MSDEAAVILVLAIFVAVVGVGWVVGGVTIFWAVLACTLGLTGWLLWGAIKRSP